MIFYALSIFIIAAFQLGVSGKYTLPVTTCKQNSSDYDTCMAQAAQKEWPQFVEGLSEFNLPRLDPFHLMETKFVFDRGEIHGILNVLNTTVFGLAKLRFVTIRPHLHGDTLYVEIYVRMPLFLIDGNFTGAGNLGPFRMHSKGHFSVTTDDVKIRTILVGHIENDTLTLEHFRNIISLEKMKLNVRDIFGDSSELVDVIIAFVNEYWPSLFRVIMPVISETLDPLLTDLANRFATKVSFKELIPQK